MQMLRAGYKRSLADEDAVPAPKIKRGRYNVAKKVKAKGSKSK